MFGAPFAFLWLLLVGPILVVLYLMRQEAQVYEVPSILHLLQLPEAPLPVRRRLKRFVRHPLFYAQLALLCLLVAALARPVLERQVHHVVLVVDVTASMQAKEGDRSRLEVAIEKASELVPSMGGEARVAVLAAGRGVRRVSGFTSDKGEILRLLKEIGPTDTAGSCTEAIYAATNLLISVGGGDVVLFTDSPFALPEQLKRDGLGIRIVGIGSRRENVGIVSVNVPVNLMTGGEHVVAHLRNFGRDEVRSEVVALVGGDEAGREKVSISPMGARSVTFQLKGLSGVVHLELAQEDALDVDNHAYAFLVGDRKLSIRLVSERSDLRGLLEGLGAFEVHTTRPGELVESQGTPADITVIDGAPPHRAPRGNCIFLGPTGDGPFFTAAGRTAAEIYFWEEGHPLLNQVSLDNLHLGTYPKLELQNGAETVIGARDTPILAAHGSEEQRQLVLAPDLAEMLDSPSAILLLFRMLEWCNPLADHEKNFFPAGDTLTCAIPEDAMEVAVVLPSGETVKTRPSGSGLVFSQTSRVGPYRVVGPGLDRTYISGLSGPAESDLTQVAANSETAGSGARLSRGTVTASHSPWMLVAIAFLLLGEWLAYFRTAPRADGSVRSE